MDTVLEPGRSGPGRVQDTERYGYDDGTVARVGTARARGMVARAPRAERDADNGYGSDISMRSDSSVGCADLQFVRVRDDGQFRQLDRQSERLPVQSETVGTVQSVRMQSVQ